MHNIFNPVVSRDNACNVFKRTATSVWNLLGNAHRENFSIREETITEMLLLELQLSLSPNILVYQKKLSAQDESQIGADWIWAIVGKNNQTMILYVQAKKFFPASNAYTNLWNDNSNPNAQARQLLNNYYIFLPSRVPMCPIYIFYNYFPGHTNNISCNCLQSFPVQYSGCSYADAFDVLNVINAGHKDLGALYPIQYAWHCLVCDCKSSNVNLAQKFYNIIVGNASAYRRKLTLLSEIDRRYRNFSPETYLQNQPPRFVTDIIENTPSDIFNEKYSQLADLNIDRIVVMKEIE